MDYYFRRSSGKGVLFCSYSQICGALLFNKIYRKLLSRKPAMHRKHSSADLLCSYSLLGTLPLRAPMWTSGCLFSIDSLIFRWGLWLNFVRRGRDAPRCRKMYLSFSMIVVALSQHLYWTPFVISLFLDTCGWLAYCDGIFLVGNTCSSTLMPSSSCQIYGSVPY